MKRGVAIVTIGWLTLVGGRFAWAQADPDAAAEASLDVATLANRRAQLENATGLDVAERSAALEFYAQAEEFLAQAAASAQRAEEYRAKSTEAPGLLEAIRAELAEPPKAPYVDAPPEITLAQTEQALAEAEAQLTEARHRAEELQREPQRRSERRGVLAKAIADVRGRLQAVSAALAGPAGADAPHLAEARRTALLAQRLALQREVEATEAELASYDARTNLLPARTDRALREVELAQQRVSLWQEVALLRRRMEAEEGTREAERLSEEAMGKTPALRRLAERNEELADMRAGADGVAAKLERVTAELSRTRERESALRDRFRSTRRKVEAAGLTPAMGVLLRKQYEDLPEPGLLRRDARARQANISQAQYQLILVEEWRTDSGDIERQLQPLLMGVGGAPGEDTAEFETVARQLLTARRDLLDGLLNDYTTYFDRLVELDVTMRGLAQTAAAYRSYIEERILWVRSAPLVDEAGRAPRRGYDVRGTGEALAWWGSPTGWRRVLQITQADSRRHWVLTTSVIMFVLLLLLVHRRLFVRMREVADAVRRPSTDDFILTAEAVAVTVLLAAPGPLVLWLLGWRIGAPVQQTLLGLAGGQALRTAALFALVAESVRQALRDDGLADVHFRWPAAALKLVRRHLRWLMPIGFVVIVLVVAMEQQDSEIRKHGLGRLAFIAGMGALAFFGRRLLHARTAAMREVYARTAEGWLGRVRFVWSPLALGVPIALAALAGAGYYYTALQLWGRLQYSLLFALGLILINALLLRWLFIARRRLVFEKARQRREAASAEAAVPPGADAPAVSPALDEAALSIPALNVQTRRLFSNLTAITLIVGLLVIWADVLPALRMLDRVQVWPSVQVIPAAHVARGPVDSPVPVAEGGEPGDAAAAAESSPLLGPMSLPETSGSDTNRPAGVVTLSDIGLAALIFVVTLVAARNLPGLLEIAFLQRLPLDAGARYAVTTTARYAITIMGFTAAFSAVGVGWATVQWLAAALTFGLAFGLQEIFANFVSGLIILAERPIRLGDTVTVGDINGTVTRIRMRATTILDWERKELIVPNKVFITDQLINWSLSDPILRRTVHVGVAYGSDVEKTVETLLRMAKENALVLDDPAPNAFFLGFGDSALEFELRVFIPSPEYRFLVPHQLHVAIDAAFRKAGIEIAFPQRDLHIRSAEALTPFLEAQPADPGKTAPSSD